jgi:putative endonuclease
MYYAYLLQCSDESIYTGITTDLERRLEQHKSGSASNYTRSRGVQKILYTEKVGERGAALKREAEIKRWPRVRKLALATAKRHG